MKQKPILFSTPMVQAILENRKTMTRRMYGLEKINVLAKTWELDKISQVKSDTGFETMIEFQGVLGEGDWMEVFPHFSVGDVMWVRETFFDARKFKSAPLFADGPDFYFRADKDVFIGEHKWKSSLFMPKEAARIFLEVTAIRCERLMSITESDAIAEGVESVDHIDFRKYKEYTTDEFCLRYPTHSFFSLWRKINGRDSVALNPWVFIYEFKRIEKP